MNTLLRRRMMMCKRNWLTPSTIQTINTAFGNDGYKVVNATNDYLNGIALTDMNKATNLAGYINEDAMLVCSIGIEPQGVTMPIRWLVGDGTSYVNSNIVVTSNVDITVKYKGDGTTAVYQQVFGSRSGSSTQTNRFGFYAYHVSLNKQILDVGGYRNQINIIQNITKPHTYRYYNGVFYCDNITQNVTNNNLWPTVSLYLGALHNTTVSINGVSDFIKGNVAFYDIKDTANYMFVPIVCSTKNGMVDIKNGTYHPNLGTGAFGEYYTLQDGETPWTPQT